MRRFIIIVVIIIFVTTNIINIKANHFMNDSFIKDEIMEDISKHLFNLEKAGVLDGSRGEYTILNKIPVKSNYMEFFIYTIDRIYNWTETITLRR